MADYLEGDLELDKRALFDAHIDECAQCASEINEMRGTISLLHRLPEPQVPAGMSREVMRRIRAGESHASWGERLRAIFGPVLEPRILAPASAAVLVLGLVLGTSGFRLQSVDPSSSLGPVMAAASMGSGGGVDSVNEAGLSLVRQDAPNVSGPRVIRLTPKQEMVAISRLLESTSPLGQIRFQVWPEPPLAAGPSYLNPRSQSEFQTVSVRPDDRRSLGTGESRAALTGLTNSKQPSADEWLARLQEDPGSFASRLATASLAEQELWVAHLAKRAVEQQRLNQVVASLRSSPSRRARLLADDFEAAGR